MARGYETEDVNFRKRILLTRRKLNQAVQKKRAKSADVFLRRTLTSPVVQEKKATSAGTHKVSCGDDSDDGNDRGENENLGMRKDAKKRDFHGLMHVAKLAKRGTEEGLA